MPITLDTYLDKLLSFVPRSRGNRIAGDHVSLIHVPTDGPECVYSIRFDDTQPILSVSRFKQAVWELLESGSTIDRPELDALQVAMPPDHPAFGYLGVETLADCRNYNDGRPGMDYFLMIWQRDGLADVVECWEPYLRDQDAWLQVIGSLQVLASQYEYLAECSGA